MHSPNSKRKWENDHDASYHSGPHGIKQGRLAHDTPAPQPHTEHAESASTQMHVLMEELKAHGAKLEALQKTSSQELKALEAKLKAQQKTSSQELEALQKTSSQELKAQQKTFYQDKKELEAKIKAKPDQRALLQEWNRVRPLLLIVPALRIFL